MAKQNPDWKKIFAFDTKFSKKLAVRIRKWVKADMIKGQIQGKPSKYSQKRKRTGQKIYVDYKKNFMNRFTTREIGGVTKAKGTKLKAYEGVSVRSNITSSVNMYLTGQLIDGLRYGGNDRKALTMTYNPKDKDKIVGNEKLGRDIRTLNVANQKKVKVQIIKQFDKNKRKFLKKNIVINIGR